MKRPLGQHFLVSPSIIHRILRALDLNASDAVLEIGPGKGALTFPLVHKVCRILLVEKDPFFAERLQEKFQNDEKIHIKLADFLELPWEEIVAVLGEDFKVVSNLPYQASTAILMSLLWKLKPKSTMVLMFQKEVAERILAKPHCKDFGSLTILVEIFSKARSILEVPPSAFRPRPQVQSTVLKFHLREEPLLPKEEIPRFEKLLHAGFAHRRKMLRQNLRPHFGGATASQIEALLISVKASPQARAEELSAVQWIQLFKAQRG